MSDSRQRLAHLEKVEVERGRDERHSRERGQPQRGACGYAQRATQHAEHRTTTRRMTIPGMMVCLWYVLQNLIVRRWNRPGTTATSLSSTLVVRHASVPKKAAGFMRKREHATRERDSVPCSIPSEHTIIPSFLERSLQEDAPRGGLTVRGIEPANRLTGFDPINSPARALTVTAC